MGLKPGEKIKRLCQIEVTDVRVEPLDQMSSDREYGDADATAEGFPEMSGRDFVEMFCDHMGGTGRQAVTRIEFRYLEPWEAGYDPTKNEAVVV